METYYFISQFKNKSKEFEGRHSAHADNAAPESQVIKWNPPCQATDTFPWVVIREIASLVPAKQNNKKQAIAISLHWRPELDDSSTAKDITHFISAHEEIKL